MLANGGDDFIGYLSLERLRYFVLSLHGKTVKDVLGDEIIFPQLVGETELFQIFLNPCPAYTFVATFGNGGKPQATGYILQLQIDNAVLLVALNAADVQNLQLTHLPRTSFVASR